MADLVHNIQVVQAVAPAVHTATKSDAAVIDLQGAGSATVIVNTGAIAGDGDFTASLAQMLAEKGIRANSVAPGPVWTPLIPATMPPEKVEGFGEQVPMGRAGQPAELAPVYVLLASDEASYVSGARIAVTGGKPIL